MLVSLTIENIAIIEEAQIDFAGGFNCLTGETGAGKSIIIDSINCIIGEKTSRELIRHGCRSAKVTALFGNINGAARDALASMDIAAEDDGSLAVSRTIFPDGKNVCRVNGENVTVSMLKTLGRTLINIHGQHDSQDLLLPEKHIFFIDSVADNEREFAEYLESYREIKRLGDEMDRLSADEEERQKKLDLLKFRIGEIRAAKIVPGERDRLKEKLEIAENAQKLAKDLSRVAEMLDGTDDTDGARQLAKESADILSRDAKIVPSVRAQAEQLLNSAYEIGAAADEIKHTLAGISFSVEEIDAINDRLEQLDLLSKKYGATEEDILDYLAKAEQEKEQNENADELLSELNEKFGAALADVKQKARALSETRRKAAAEFSQRIMNELKELNMPSVTFSVDRKATPLTETGIDSMEFLISANAGEPPKPIAKIASGGELSRIMLAIKTVLAGRDMIDTLVFDEIDTGVSGSAAERIAIKMKSISASRQVLCVTHLPQIAAYADNHFLIEKTVRGDRTFTEITVLDRKGRIAEIARISGGANITENGLKSAEDLLDSASGGK